jgi:hypothetical protein
MVVAKSLWSRLGQGDIEAPDQVVERIRAAMLGAIEVHCETQDVAVYMPIRYARDISSLWFLRPHLMQAIASSRNEAIAVEVLHQITDLFKGHLASANASRFGSL